MVKILKKLDYSEFYKINEYVAKSSPMMSHYLSTNPIERWIWQQKKEFIKKTLSKLPIGNLVDLGCGDGGILDILTDGIQYTGIDISPTQLEYAKKRAKKLGKKNTQFYMGDILNLEVNDSSFDSAIVCDVVEHVLSTEKLFNEIKRVVKKNGYIIISIPNEPLWEVARAILFKFPLRSPDHINAVFPQDIYDHFSKVLVKKHIPIPFSASFSLINTFLIENVK